jgi:CubicO group peptidase (beta-lactamase class C family)
MSFSTAARRVSRLVAALAAILCPAAAAAQRPAVGDAVAAGFSAERLARVDSTFDRMVASGELVGAVALVLRDGVPVYERAFGWADREAGRRMGADAIFRIASQTKALTSVAIMILAEEGRLGINDPVARYIPAYGRTTVSVMTDSGRITVPALRPITLRDLLTHTAGISYGASGPLADAYAERGLGPAAGFGWYTADKDEPICETMERLAGLPFAAHPGERYVYGYATDILGCVVERASGMPLDRFIESRITAPLGMRDTRFFLPPADTARLAAVYARAADGSLGRAPEGARGQGHYVTGPRRSFAGGAGLLSTARDYARFLQMLLARGELDGVRILAPKTVDMLVASQVGMLYSQLGEGYSLAFRTIDRPGARGQPFSPGTFGWGGAYGSYYDVDPAERLVLVFMTQELPNTGRVADRFPMLVYQALLETGADR